MEIDRSSSSDYKRILCHEEVGGNYAKTSTEVDSFTEIDQFALHRVVVGFLFEKGGKKCRLRPSIVPDFRICKFKARCTL